MSSSPFPFTLPLTAVLSGMILLLGPGPALALVDYSSMDSPPSEGPSDSGAIPLSNEDGGVKIMGSPKGKGPLPKFTSSRQKSGGSSGEKFHFLSLSTGVDSMKVNLGREGQVQRYQMAARVNVGRSFYTQFSYFQAKGNLWAEEDLEEGNNQGKEWQKGNPRVGLGFTWLSFGQKDDLTTIDLLGGVVVRTENSLVGTSRNDKWAGFSTAKRFYSLSVGLLGEWRFPGQPRNEKELTIGPIQKVGGVLVWTVSQDIKFGLEVSAIQVRPHSSQATQSGDPGGLTDKVSFSSISPGLSLGLGGNVEFQMGLVLRTRKVSSTSADELKKARLYDLPGLYGNSFLLGLDFSV